MIYLSPIDGSPLWALKSTAYSKALHMSAKEVPGMTWNGKAWVGWPDAVAICTQKVEERGVAVEGELPALLKFSSREIKAHKWPAGIRDYQKAGVLFLLGQAADGALLADDMGLGKTRQAITAIELIDKPAIVVCPSFVREVWKREIAKWLPAAPIVELTGTKADSLKGTTRDNAPAIYLVHYDVLHAWTDKLLDMFRSTVGSDFVLVVDEIHFCQSEKARRSQAVKLLARASGFRIGLSGTPMTNRPRDLWNVVDTLSEGRFGRPFSFFIRHADAHKEEVAKNKVVWITKGASNLEELAERMQYFMLRRTKSDVELELPARTRQIIEVEVPRKFHQKPDDALKNEKALRAALALAADGKLPKAAELVVNHVESESKVVVFCWRKAVAEALAVALMAEGIDTKVITGDVDVKKRQAIIDEKPTVLCCTMASTQVGIDFSYADIAVFVELDWVPSTLAQCEARLHRFGQKKNVLIQYVIAQSTADEIIAETVVDKIANFEAGIGKTDDGLRQDLEGQKLSTVEQLASLYKKLKVQQAKEASP
jgi:SWI/SNF-related matrix-associated actin-dependent regulator of chromatin subfamily A-like protein 1